MVVASLSEEGRKFLGALMAAVEPHYAAILDGIDEVAITDHLDQMEQNLRALGDRLRMVQS
jgi:hypothetical protein